MQYGSAGTDTAESLHCSGIVVGQLNHKRVERIWRREGLKVPKKQPKRGRLWLNDGSCIRLKRTIADLALDKQILKEAAEGNF